MTTYAQHNVILRKDKKFRIVVEVIEDRGLLAADCSKCRKRYEANKTWTSVQAHFKKAAKDLKFQQSMRSGGFANAGQQTSNLAADAIDQQAAAINSSNTLVQHSNTLCANYAKLVRKLEAPVRRSGSNDGGSGSGHNSGPLPKLTFAQFIHMVRNNLHYCHFCRLCNHKNSACIPSTRKPGHKSEATVTNRLGGTTAVPTSLSDLGLKIK